MTTIYVPRDSAARSVGADDVAAALATALPDARIVRNGSRGMLWLEPLVEVATPAGRVAYGPVTADDVPALAAALPDGGAHPLRLGVTDELPWLASQTRLTFARVGVVDPLDPDDFVAHGGLAGLHSAAGPRRGRRPSRTCSRRACAGAAAPASRPASSGARSRRPRPPRSTCASTPTRATAARTPTACSSRATPSPSSRAWRSRA